MKIVIALALAGLILYGAPVLAVEPSEGRHEDAPGAAAESGFMGDLDYIRPNVDDLNYIRPEVLDGGAVEGGVETTLETKE